MGVQPALYIGLMSGTSMDGVDGVLAAFPGDGGPPIQVLAHAHRAFSADQAQSLLALNSAGPNELHRAALAGNALARLYAEGVKDLLQGAAIAPAAVSAIGAHGQTVRHQPQAFDGCGYTIQLNNPALLAELTGIAVVADLRSRDLAAGGQGAPLVPAFHRAVFGRDGRALAVLNLGGMANLTALAADGGTLGFDCGPGNALLDHWCQRHTGQPFDDGGRWGAGGTVAAALLAAMQAEPFFALPPPKSTGRDLFNPAWLQACLAGVSAATASAAQDVQASLAELTAWSCAQAVKQYAARSRELLVCGGGAYNAHLMQRLAAHLPTLAVLRSDAAGLPASQVEAAAFAWLAKAFVERRPGNLASVTGAAGPRILGALYPAG